MTSPRTPCTPAGQNISTSDIRLKVVANTAIDQLDCQQDPAELAALLDLLQRRVRPRLVLEIGGWAGGSAWAWHQLASAPLVFTVTLPWSPMGVWADRLPAWHTAIWGDSRDSNVIAETHRQLAGNRPDMVFIDGCHHYEVARSDWQTYGPLARPGGPVVFHDINDFPNHPDLQVHKLWAELKSEYPAVELVSHPGQACGTGIIWP